MVAPRGTRRTLPLLCLLVVCLDRTLAWDLVLLHTNDVHARMEPTSSESGKCAPAKAPCFAGVARRSWQVNEIRNREKNVLLLDAGDQFQGSVWFNFYKGAEAAFFMNRLRYDAMVGASTSSTSELLHLGAPPPRWFSVRSDQEPPPITRVLHGEGCVRDSRDRAGQVWIYCVGINLLESLLNIQFKELLFTLERAF